MATEQDPALFGWGLEEWNIQHDHQDYEATNQVGRSQEFPGSEEAHPAKRRKQQEVPQLRSGQEMSSETQNYGSTSKPEKPKQRKEPIRSKAQIELTGDDAHRPNGNLTEKEQSVEAKGGREQSVDAKCGRASPQKSTRTSARDRSKNIGGAAGPRNITIKVAGDPRPPALGSSITGMA